MELSFNQIEKKLNGMEKAGFVCVNIFACVLRGKVGSFCLDMLPFQFFINY